MKSCIDCFNLKICVAERFLYCYREGMGFGISQEEAETLEIINNRIGFRRAENCGDYDEYPVSGLKW